MVRDSGSKWAVGEASPMLMATRRAEDPWRPADPAKTQDRGFALTRLVMRSTSSLPAASKRSESIGFESIKPPRATVTLSSDMMG